MCDDINRMGGASGEFTGLIWPLTATDPDDAFSSVPYEKGFNLLNYLETLVGSDIFMAFAKAYLQKFKFSTVTSGEFRDTFVEFVASAEGSSPALVSTVSSLDWDDLFLSKGLPKYPTPDFSNSLAQVAEALAAKWIGKVVIGSTAPVNTDDVSAKDIEVSASKFIGCMEFNGCVFCCCR